MGQEAGLTPVEYTEGKIKSARIKCLAMGDGNLHIYLLKDDLSDEIEPEMKEAMQLIYNKAHEFEVWFQVNTVSDMQRACHIYWRHKTPMLQKS